MPLEISRTDVFVYLQKIVKEQYLSNICYHSAYYANIVILQHVRMSITNNRDIVSYILNNYLEMCRIVIQKHITTNKNDSGVQVGAR